MIELLTVIAIIGILAAILIPTVGRVRETARRTVDASNIRQIVQAALIYSNDFDGRLPGTAQTKLGTNGEIDAAGTAGGAVTLTRYAAALARTGGLNDANLWISQSDQAAVSNPTLTVVLDNANPRVLDTNFAAGTTIHSYLTISGLTMSLPSSTPVAFTRGLGEGGAWAASTGTAAGGVYGVDGGYVGFLGGNVQFFPNLGATAPTGKLTATNSTPTNNIRQAIPLTAGIATYTLAPLSSLSGLAP